MQKTRRRLALATLASGALAPLASFAQQPSAVRRIGILSIVARESPFPRNFPDRLRRLGYEEGKNLAIEWRLAAGDARRLPVLAQELVRLNPELIVAHVNESIAAIKETTRTIPIVMVATFMPVEMGFVKTLARPGGNITGAAWIGTEQMGKVLELLKLAAPGTVHIAITPPTFFPALWKSEVERITRALGMKPRYFPIARREDAPAVLEQIAAMRPDALVTSGDAVTLSIQQEIAAFAIRHKLITVSSVSVFAENGLLLAFSPDASAIHYRAATYVDRILRGANPADLPVELPTRFSLIINAKTAGAIGYTIPQSLLARADRVIE